MSTSAARPRPRRRRGRRGDGDQGVTVIIVALMLVVILMFVAFAIDGGMAYLSHRTSQNAADAGAFAGVRVLDHLKFDPNCTPTITPSCPFNSTAFIASDIIQQVADDGGDSANTHCYLVDFSATRVIDPLSGTTRDLCAGGTATAADVGELTQAYGVESWATVVRASTFARIGSASLSQTRASTHAVVMIQNFAGAQGSPFIVCGSSADPGDYNILTQTVVNGTPSYGINSSSLNQFYVLQSSQVPGCGADSNSFKGLSGGQPLVLDQWNDTTPGNGNISGVSEQILGATPCTDAQVAALNFNGCGVLIPIATQNRSTGRSLQSFIVAWTVWNVWGDGTGQSLNGVPPNPVSSDPGSGCKNPLLGSDGGGGAGAKTAGMKYCGELLGSYAVVAGGAGSGPPVSGAARVFHLVG